MPNRMVVSRKALVPMSARLSVVSTIFPKNCKRQSRVRVVQTVRPRKRISIARDNWPTTLIHCVVLWTNEPHAAMASSRGNSRDNSRGRQDNKDRRGAGKRGARGVEIG